MTWKFAPIFLCCTFVNACTSDLSEEFNAGQGLSTSDDSARDEGESVGGSSDQSSDGDAPGAEDDGDRGVLTTAEPSDTPTDAGQLENQTNDPAPTDGESSLVESDAGVMPAPLSEAGTHPDGMPSDVQPAPMASESAQSEAGASHDEPTDGDLQDEEMLGEDSSGGDSDSATAIDAGASDAGPPIEAPDCSETPSDPACAPANECPDDPDKLQPGTCGCGVPDVDADADGVLDCQDDCPQDVNKVEAGHCGCGMSDAADADADSEPDCTDECPDDAAKILAGNCGCATAEAICDALAVALVHRYSFNGSGANLLDSVGSAHGAAMETTLTGSGRLELAGTGSGEYGLLPMAALSGLVDATFEIWLEWDGEAGAWERILDIGRGGPVVPGTGGVDFFFLSVDGAGSVGLAAGVFLDGGSVDQVDVPSPLSRNELKHLVVVFDDTGNMLHLYLDGELLESDALASSFAEIEAEFFWLGQSHYTGDPTFLGAYEELRIYSEALSSAEIAASYLRGPNAVFE